MPILECTVQDFAVLAFALEQSIAQLQAGLLGLSDTPALRTTREHIQEQLTLAEALLARINDVRR